MTDKLPIQDLLLMHNLKLVRYPEYKDSGVDWLGEIPAGWHNIKCKFITEIYTGSSISDDRKDNFVSDNLKFIPYIATKDIDLNTSLINYSNGMRIDPQLNHDFKLATPNSILLCIEGGSAGKKISFVEQNIYFVNKLACFKIKHYYSKYYFYYLQSSTFLNQFYILMNGLIGGVSISNIRQIIAIVPRLKEQQSIAGFLDTKTVQIDKAIAQKEKMIELLKEYQQVVINNAVTKGLDRNVELKPSGVDWLGEIPVGWKVKRLKYCFDIIQTGSTPSTKNSDYFINGGVSWYSPKDLDASILLQSERFVTNHALLSGAVKLFSGDSVLVVGIGATSGKTAYLTNDGCFNQQITGFYSKKNHNKYFFYLLQNLSKIMLNLADFTTMQILSNTFFKDFILVVPPLAEQQSIVNYLDKKTAQINEFIKLQQQQIQKLKEYKATLINSAVTGKIRI